MVRSDGDCDRSVALYWGQTCDRFRLDAVLRPPISIGSPQPQSRRSRRVSVDTEARDQVNSDLERHRRSQGQRGRRVFAGTNAKRANCPRSSVALQFPWLRKHRENGSGGATYLLSVE